MFTHRTTAILAMGLMMTALTGCYVVPVNSSYPGYPGATVTPAPPVAIVPAPIIQTARLYPINEIAARNGALTAQVTDYQNGRATFTVNLATEVLSGEATGVGSNHPGFGSVMRNVLGANVQTTGYARRGIANGSGTRGSFIRCEYVFSSTAAVGSQQGTGACEMHDGARYQMHFG